MPAAAAAASAAAGGSWVAAVVAAVLVWLAAPSQCIVRCGHCMCDGASITCNFGPSQRRVTQLSQLAPSAAQLQQEGLRALQFKELFVNCKDAASISGQRVTRRLLRDFANITHLAIVKCDVVRVDPDALADLRQLRKFEMSGNRLQWLPAGLFAGKRMTLVKVSENPGLRLADESLVNAQLERLVLSRCELADFPLRPLLRVAGLRQLTLSHNRIRLVPPQALQLVQQLSVFYLDSNPIVCACANRWLLRSVPWQRLSPDIASPKQPTCGSPRRLSGRRLPQLSASDFACPAPRIGSVQLHVDSDWARLSCTADSEQQEPLVWSVKGDAATMAGEGEGEGEGEGTSVRVVRRLGGSRSQLLLSATDADGQSANFSLAVRWPTLPIAAATSPSPSAASTASAAPAPPPGGRRDGDADYFADKQFTLVEMILAVIGTFLSTSLVFLASCQLSRWRRRREKQRWAAYVSHASASGGFATAPRRPQSQEYDVPRLDQPCLAKPHALEFVDYNGRRLLYSH